MEKLHHPPKQGLLPDLGPPESEITRGDGRNAPASPRATEPIELTPSLNLRTNYLERHFNNTRLLDEAFEKAGLILDKPGQQVLKRF